MAVFHGTKHNDTFNESSDTGNDTFDLYKGGNDTVIAGSGDDRFNMGVSLNSGDRLDGGAGRDVVFLHGDYSTGLTFDDQTIQNIEVLRLGKGFNYDLTLADGNVAAGETLTINAAPLGAGNHLTFDGSLESDGHFVVYGGAGNDTITGGAKADVFHLENGGNDTAHGGGGNDTIFAAVASVANDALDGGSGHDTLVLGAGVVDFTAGTGSLTSIETLAVNASTISTITMADGDVAAGATLTVDYSSSNDPSGSYTFDGGLEIDGHFAITGPQSAAAVDFTGGNLSDTFNMQDSGTDTINGGGGDDTITYGSNFANAGGGTSSTDEIIGGAGNDTLVLTGGLGSYFFGGSTVFTMGIGQLSSVETMKLEGASDYVMKLQNGTVGFGATMTIDGTGATGNIQIDGSSLVNGSLHFIAGAGNQDAYFAGGTNADVFDMSALASTGSVTGGGGDDIINFGGNLSHGLPVQGGSGSDTLNLDGDYSGGQFISDSNVTGIETMTFAAGNSYWLIIQGDITNDGSSTSALTVDGAALGASDVMTLDLSGATSPGYAVTGGAAGDTFTFGSSFANSSGGLGTTSTVDGGGGNDTVVFTGGFGQFFNSTAFGSGTLTSIETIKLEGAQNYNIAIQDGNIANGATLTVDTSAVTLQSSGFFIEVDASAVTKGSLHFIGSSLSEDQTYNGGANADTFDFTGSGGPIFTRGNGGDDVFDFAGNLSAAISLDGGAGRDTINLDGDYSGLHVINGSNGITGIEAVHFAAGHSYNIGFANEVTDGGGATLTVDGSALGASDVMTLNFTNATSAGYSITGGAADDSVTMGASLHATDVIDGGGGTNTLTFNGDLSAGVTLTNVQNFQTFVFTDGHSYNLTTADGNVASGATLTVEGTLLTGSNALTFNGSAETDGKFALIGGAANDTLTGGAGDDIINGLGGADTLAGGGGADTFIYTNGVASNSGTLDHITDFDPTQTDALEVGGGANFVSQVNISESAGTLDADLAAAIAAAGSHPAHFAIAVNFTGGDFSGQTFIIVDTNGNTAYDAGSDLVVEVTGSNNFNLHPVTASDFI